MNDERADHAGTPGRFDVDIEMLAGCVDRLHELAGDPSAANDPDQRYDVSIRWGVLLSGRLRRLLHYEQRGELPAEEQQRFDELRERLYEVASVAWQLGLADPVGVLDPNTARKVRGRT